MQTPPPPWPPSSSFLSSDPDPAPPHTQPQRAPARSLLANLFDGANPFTPAAPVPPLSPPPSQPPVPPPSPPASHLPTQPPVHAPVAQPPKPVQPVQPARSPASDDGVYRWERLSPAQQEAAWQMVAQMRGAVSQERTRQRRRATLLGLAILLVATLDSLLLYLLSTGPAFWHAL